MVAFAAVCGHSSGLAQGLIPAAPHLQHSVLVSARVTPFSRPELCQQPCEIMCHSWTCFAASGKIGAVQSKSLMRNGSCLSGTRRCCKLDPRAIEFHN